MTLRRTINILLGLAFVVLLMWIYTLNVHSQVPLLTREWTPAGLKLTAQVPGCLYAQPNDVGMDACDHVSGPWWFTVPRYGSDGISPNKPGRTYELRNEQGIPIATVNVPNEYQSILPIVVVKEGQE